MNCPNNNNETMFSSRSRSSSSSGPALSIQDLVIQRQRQLLLKKEQIQLTREQQRLFLSPGEDNSNGNEINFNNYVSHITTDNNKTNMDNANVSVSVNANAMPPPPREYFSFSPSPTSVITRKTTGTTTGTTTATTKMEVARDNRTHDYGVACSTSATGQQHHHEHQHQQRQQRAVDFSCLYPRDDQRSRVRFNPGLSVYDHCEDDDYDDDHDHDHDNSGEGIRRNEKTTNENDEDDRALFLLRRARRCWYSMEELRTIKDERRSIIRMLKRHNCDVKAIDTSMYELRGLEPYLSLEINTIIHVKRKEAWESVLNEQRRQRQPGNKIDAERIQIVSRMASEWFRNQAYQTALMDAKEACDSQNHPDPDPSCSRSMIMMCIENDDNGNDDNNNIKNNDNDNQTRAAAKIAQAVAMLQESLHESFGLMDIDDYGGGDGSGNDNDNSTLSYWANSSWTKDYIMDGRMDGRMTE